VASPIQQTAALRASAEAPRAAGVAGLVFAVLFTVSFLLVRNHPQADSTAAQVADWYLDKDKTRVALVGLYLVPFAGIAFLWFAAVIRHNVLAARDRFFDAALMGSAILFIAMLFAAGASGGSLFAAVEFRDAPAPSPDAVGVTRALAYTFFYVYALRAAAVFIVVTSSLGLRSAGLPRWLAVSGIATAAVLLLSVSFVPLVALLFPAWVTAVSIVILRRSWRYTAFDRAVTAT
jgi:hypothetical protein